VGRVFHGAGNFHGGGNLWDTGGAVGQLGSSFSERELVTGEIETYGTQMVAVDLWPQRSRRQTDRRTNEQTNSQTDGHRHRVKLRFGGGNLTL